MAQIPIVDERHKRIGLISSLVVLAALFIYLNFTTFMMADPPPKDIVVKTSIVLPKELSLPALKIEGGSSGNPKDAKLVSQPRPQSQKVLTKDKSKTTERTGESNSNTTQHDAQNENTTTKVSENPFGPGGDNDGNDGGKNKGFGGDEGDGAGPGKSGGKKPRVRISVPNSSDIESDQSCKITYRVYVNSKGDVVKAEHVPGSTTTVNQILINKVKALVIRDTKYNEVPGAATETYTITLNLTAR